MPRRPLADLQDEPTPLGQGTVAMIAPPTVPRLLALAAVLALALPASGQEESERDRRNGHLARQLVAILRNDEARHPAAARAAAARALGDMGIDARFVLPELIQVLSNPRRNYPFVVEEALVRAVGEIGPPARAAIPALVRSVGQDRDLDRAIGEVIRRVLGTGQVDEDVAVLARLLRSPDVGERLRAAKRLAALGPDARGALAELTAALLDIDRDVSRQALAAIQAIRLPGPPSKQALGVFIRDLGDDDPAVRLAAAKSLGRLGPPARGALAALQAAARNDPDEDVRKVAGDAVARIQGSAP